MEKSIFYCDCDGVILNTVEVAYEIMREHGVNISKRIEVDDYFKRFIDWKEIFKKTEIINHATDRLRYIKDSRLFEDVMILTKLSGGYDEERLKRDLFRKLIPEIKVITLQYGLEKGIVVPAENNLLVDDEIGNCEKWEKQNGTAVLFTPYMSSVDNNIISDLSELRQTAGVKKLIKTRKI